MLDLKEYTGYPDVWDATIDDAINGTIFHKISFLSYHAPEKFNPVHLQLWQSNRIVGLISFDLSPDNGILVARSPFGGSYGGICWTERPKARICLEAMDALISHLNERGAKEALITPPPAVYYRHYEASAEMAIQAIGGILAERQVTSILDLREFRLAGLDHCEGRCRTAYRKALKSRLVINRKPSIEDFYSILIDNKARRGALPTHSLEEFKTIQKRFPSELVITTAELDGKPIGGIAYFRANRTCCLLFYVCHLTDHDRYNSPTLLIMDALEQEEKEGLRYFDFGTTCTKSNMREKLSLFSFKESFGTYGVFRDTYRITI